MAGLFKLLMVPRWQLAETERISAVAAAAAAAVNTRRC